MLDADNSGTISFTEFAFYLVFTQMPDNQVRRCFKKQEPKNRITQEEFSKMIRSFSKKAYKKNVEKTALDARLIAASDEDWERTNQKLCDNLFRGRKYLTFDEFLEIRAE